MITTNYHELRILIRNLLEAGANVNENLVLDNDRSYYPSPLYVGVIFGDAYVVELLLRFGANVKVKRTRIYFATTHTNTQEDIYEASFTTYQGHEKLALLFAYTKNFDCINYESLLKSALHPGRYKSVELVLAFLSESTTIIDPSRLFDVIIEIIRDRKKNNLSKLLFTTFPNLKECMLCSQLRTNAFPVKNYLLEINTELYDFVSEGLPTLFDLITLHLHFEDIRNETQNLRQISTPYTPYTLSN